MKKELDDLLCSKYPKIFKNRNGDMRTTAMCWGLDCGDGWFTLLDTLCGLLQWDTDHNKHPQIVASQVKEKYGTLRFYTEGGDEYQHGVINMAESMSAHICDVCGNIGKITGSNWVTVRCQEHMKE